MDKTPDKEKSMEAAKNNENQSKDRQTVTKTFSIKHAISKRLSWKTIKEWLVSFITTVAIAVIILLVIIISVNILNNFLSGYFPKVVEKSLVVEILKGIIQVDGILLGFNGVVYAQLLWSVNSFQNTISQKIFDTNGDKKSLLEGLKSLQSERRILILALLFVAILYLGSIYYALAHMAWTGDAQWTGSMPILGFIYIPTILLFAGTVISMVIAFTRKLTIIETDDEEIAK